MDNVRRLLILYGSQTGCAQEVAERIWRESKWYLSFFINLILIQKLGHLNLK